MLTQKDKEQISLHGIPIENVNYQINKFKSGFPPMELNRAAIPGDGIMVPNEEEKEYFTKYYETGKESYTITKFVPASGAASRMFKVLFSFLEENLGSEHQEHALLNNKKISDFFQKLDSFAFYKDLAHTIEQEGLQMNNLLETYKYAEILEFLLTDKGLNYGNLPKGLLKFHKYADETRMPVEEHLIEGAAFATNKDGKVHIHFTVSPEHEPEFKKRLEPLITIYEKKLKVEYVISYSRQLKSTDTLAVDEINQPFRNNDGSLLFRPAGHGALLRNLHNLDTDIAFLQNIDNVIPDRLKGITTQNKKILGGVLLSVRDKIIKMKSELDKNAVTESDLRFFLKKELNTYMPESADIHVLAKKLDRPIRVCGMVINTGEAGGGPFWCKNNDGSVSLQIVESSQFDTGNKAQMDIVKSSTHFNPVDVVVFKTNLQGNPYDLMNHVDTETAFISSKSKDGKALQAMELPGLWNGSMSDWNTVFVEVPAITFNPVKEVNDLLRDEHQ